MNHKVNILGSCVSRLAMLDGDLTGHGIADDQLALGYFLDKQNIICAVMPPPFPREDVLAIRQEELWDGSRWKSLQQCLNKDTIQLLLDSDADYIVMDFYDIQADATIFGDTLFSSCAFEFFNTALCRSHGGPQAFQNVNFCNLPSWLWYAYADLFFEKILPKYDADHIILNRFRSNTYYLAKTGGIEKIPDAFKQPFHSNDRYNDALRRFEDYIIARYHPYVIDLSSYFMGDNTLWENLNGAHFEREFYRESFDIIKDIIFHQPEKRLYNQPRLMDASRRGYEEDRKRPFDVELGLKMLPSFWEQNDGLWLNLLDKLVTYAPGDARVEHCKKLCQDRLPNA